MFSVADIPVDWDDPFCVGNQVGGQLDLAWWCPDCHAHTNWTLLPFLWLTVLRLPICWWCNGPMQAEKTTRTTQRVDQTIAETRWERDAREEEHWWTFDVREYAMPFT